ncbi:MAG: YIP1 family protein [Planctomycetes bacterium]|nr:YIP1 family protein [Planctomycetota bacterium]
MDAACPYCQVPVAIQAAGEYTCPSCQAVFRVDLQVPAAAPGERPAGRPVPEGARCALHPEAEAVASCDRCGGFACADCACEMGGRLLCPACRERSSPREGLPWERREALGWWPGLRGTVAGVLLRPSLTMATMRRRGALSDAIVFSLLVTVPCAVVNQVMNLGLQGIIMGAGLLSGPASAPGSANLLPVIGGLGAVGVFSIVAAIFITPVQTLFMCGLFACIIHGTLRLLKAGRHGLETTFAAVCYLFGALQVPSMIIVPLYMGGALLAGVAGASGGRGAALALIILAVVLVGLLVLAFLAYFCVIWVKGLRAAQDLTTGQAILGFLSPYILLVCCCIGPMVGVVIFAGVMA